MDPMLASFISESRDNLETAGCCFLGLEKEPGNDELVNDLFRSIHTIKGSSGLFDMPALTKVVHAAEDVLDTVRSGDLLLTSEHVDLFLDVMDQVGAWLDDLEKSEQLGSGADASSRSHTQALRALLRAEETGQEVAVDTPKTPRVAVASSARTVVPEPPPWLLRVPDDARMALFQRAAIADLEIVALQYNPQVQCFFSGADPLHTIRQLPGLVWFQITPTDPWPEPVDLDPFQCNLVFHALAAGDAEAVHHHLRYVAEETKLHTLSPLQLAIPVGEQGDAEAFASFADQAPQVLQGADWQQLRRLIAPLLEISAPDLLQASVLRWMDALLQQKNPEAALLSALLGAASSGKFHWPDSLLQGSATEPASALAAVSEHAVLPDPPTPSTLGISNDRSQLVSQALLTQQRILAMPCPAELLDGRIASVSTVIRNLLAATQHTDSGLQQASTAAERQKSTAPLAEFIAVLMSTFNSTTNAVVATAAPPVPERREGERRAENRRKSDLPGSAETSVAPGKTLKVDQHRIDALMDLVGELVVAKNALPFLARRAEEDYHVKRLAREIKEQYAVINRLAEDLQGAMMQIRMVPISSIFQRFPRLVRDLSRRLGKTIQLVLEGEDTEADKNVVENLADPLIHLVRNSLDHGLENAQQRVTAGKPETGTITLRAIPGDDQVMIEIIDDGRGMDPHRIKRKAYEKGIIDEKRLDTLNDQDALQLIFAAGFSTAEEVSDLSGRGVGMDVVRSAVKRAGGSALVESQPGQGTTVRLRLPLSMAVTRVMMIEVDDEYFGVSMENIVETVRVPVTSIRRIKQNETVVLRNRLVPLFHLRRLLQLDPRADSSKDIAVLMMNLDGEDVGLVIDQFHEGIDIIQKPLQGVMGNYPWYVGATLLGDGRVLLVLNIKELLACR